MTAMQRHQIDKMQYMGNMNQPFLNEMDLQSQLQAQQLTSGQGTGQMNSHGRQVQFQGNTNEESLRGNQNTKANPQQGFDLLRLSSPTLENVNEDFICSICQKILNQPMECSNTEQCG